MVGGSSDVLITLSVDQLYYSRVFILGDTVVK